MILAFSIEHDFSTPFLAIHGDSFRFYIFLCMTMPTITTVTIKINVIILYISHTISLQGGLVIYFEILSQAQIKRVIPIAHEKIDKESLTIFRKLFSILFLCKIHSML